MIRPLIASLAALCATAFAAEWQTDYDTAKAAAAKENKHLFVEFTGSDWCKACMFQKKNVLSKPEFQDRASQHFVLLELDYPNKQIPADVKLKNERVRDRFDIRTFPTVLFMTPDGLPYGSMVGAKGGVPQATAEMENALQNYARYKTLLDHAVRLSGTEKTQKLLEAYDTIPENFRPYYTDLKEAIAKSDPGNVSGKALQFAREARNMREQSQLRDIRLSGQTPEEQNNAIDELISKDLLPENTVQAHILKGKALFPAAVDDASFDKCLDAYKKALDLMPADSEQAKKITQDIQELEMGREQFIKLNKNMADKRKEAAAKQ